MVTAGNYEQQIETRGLPDEIHELTVLFNEMAVNLKRQEHLVEKRTVSLEEEVRCRIKIEGEKEKLNNKLLQAYKMEAIGTLAGGIAHDFNNILGAVIGYTELAKGVGPPCAELEKHLDQVLIAGDRAKDLVGQILAFSRQAEVQRIVLKIQPLIKEGLKMLRSSIPTTISILTDIDPNTGIIRADPTQVHQILMNLCTNASHTMEKAGGVLTVSLKTTHIQPDEQHKDLNLAPGEYAELAVTDTGSGIGLGIIKRIFEPYFTTKEAGEGTGMGLAIIYGVISDCGGTITVESQMGKGSTFHVFFPVVQEEVLPEIKEQADIPTGTERILFVDDEMLLINMGKAMLEKIGYHLTTKHNSLEALETFKSQPDNFDIVITDQTMPNMTGLELAKEMLQIRPDIPIILCTGYSNLVNEKVAKAFGIRKFLYKPITNITIAKMIRKVLEGDEQPAKKVG